jgi:hypothetical protein
VGGVEMPTKNKNPTLRMWGKRRAREERGIETERGERKERERETIEGERDGERERGDRERERGDREELREE